MENQDVNSESCPSDAQLRALQRGDRTESLVPAIADHVNQCPRCQRRAEQLHAASEPVGAAIPTASAVWESLPDDATLLPPVTGAPLARAATRAAPAPVSYTFLAPPKQPGEIGRLANYRVLRLLGKGGMGYVFHAEDLSLARPVALKVMKPELGGDADSWQRFAREARLMAALKHEHLATIYQAGQEGSVIYLAMELLQGESLLDRLKRGSRLEPAAVVRLAREMASALVVIHRHGLIHRDLKPANIWLETPGDRVKILDFGLARRLEEDAHITQTGVVVGTPAFMSPEQARGAAVDGRSDLFSLGAVLYCLCTGAEPFRGPHVTAVLTALAVDTPRPVHEVNGAIPRPLSDLVLQMLAKRPEQRPPSAAAVLERLQQIDVGPTMTMTSPSAPIKLSERQLVLGLVLVIGIVAAIVGVGVVRGLSKRPALAGAVGTSPAESIATSRPEAKRLFVKTLTPIASMNWPLPPAPDGGMIPDCFRVISVKGIVSPHGIGMHPSFDGPASVSYSLGKQYQTFEAKVSLNDSSPGTDSPMIFNLYGDGRLLWKSTPVETADDTQTCKVSVKDVDTLKLEVTGRKKLHGAHGVWLEPAVSK
jgi:serine/threonine protein kinase